MWQDLTAEYDARLLQAELVRRAPGFSPELELFLEAWAEDEAKHAAALTRLYMEASGATQEGVRARLDGRSGDFEPMASFLDDEFRLSVLLAYDEAMSTHGYGADIPFYASLGGTPERQAAFAAVLRALKNDEAVHYRNAVELLACRHQGRAGEIAPLMDEIVALDAGQSEYKATFLLDHANDQFDEPGMRRVASAVVRTLERRL